MGSTDEALPKAFLDAAQINLSMIGAILVTVFTNLKFSIVILVMSVFFLFARKFYLKSSTNIKRLEGISKHQLICVTFTRINRNFIFQFAAKSPVFSHISATLSGLSTIRAFQAEKLLQVEFENHQDLNTGAWFMFIGNQLISTLFYGTSQSFHFFISYRNIVWIWNVTRFASVYFYRMCYLLFCAVE